MKPESVKIIAHSAVLGVAIISGTILVIEIGVEEAYGLIGFGLGMASRYFPGLRKKLPDAEE